MNTKWYGEGSGEVSSSKPAELTKASTDTDGDNKLTKSNSSAKRTSLWRLFFRKKKEKKPFNRGTLIGIKDVNNPTGADMCRAAMKALQKEKRREKTMVNIVVLESEVKLQKDDGSEMRHSFENMSYIWHHPKKHRLFGYVYGTLDNKHCFVAFEIPQELMMKEMTRCLAEMSIPKNVSQTDASGNPPDRSVGNPQIDRWKSPQITRDIPRTGPRNVPPSMEPTLGCRPIVPTTAPPLKPVLPPRPSIRKSLDATVDPWIGNYQEDTFHITKAAPEALENGTCAGCKVAFSTPGETPDLSLVLVRKEQDYVTGPGQQKEIGDKEKKYYHMSTSCVKRRHPSFDPRTKGLVVVNRHWYIRASPEEKRFIDLFKEW